MGRIPNKNFLNSELLKGSRGISLTIPGFSAGLKTRAERQEYFELLFFVTAGVPIELLNNWSKVNRVNPTGSVFDGILCINLTSEYAGVSIYYPIRETTAYLPYALINLHHRGGGYIMQVQIAPLCSPLPVRVSNYYVRNYKGDKILVIDNRHKLFPHRTRAYPVKDYKKWSKKIRRKGKEISFSVRLESERVNKIGAKITRRNKHLQARLRSLEKRERRKKK